MTVGCLALNASYEPLTMVPLKRALRLVIDGKAEIVEADASRAVRAARLSVPHPVVIRLRTFVHVPRRFRRQVTNTFSSRVMGIGASTAGGRTTRYDRENRSRAIT